MFFSYSSMLVSFSFAPFWRGTVVCTGEVLCLPTLLFSFDEKTGLIWVCVWLGYLLVHSGFRNTLKVCSLLPFLGWEEEKDGRVGCTWFFLKTFRLYLHKGLFTRVSPQTAEASKWWCEGSLLWRVVCNFMVTPAIRKMSHRRQYQQRNYSDEGSLGVGGELHDWDGSTGHCAGEGVQSPSSPVKSSSLQLTCIAHSFSEERERNHGVVLETPVGAVPKQGNGKHELVVGRMREGRQGTSKLQSSLGSCHSHRLGKQCW